MADFRLPVHQHQVKVNGRDYLSDGRGMFVVTNAADIVEFQKLGAVRDGGVGSTVEWADATGTALVGPAGSALYLTEMFDYYVDSVAGSDANDGRTGAAAFATIAKVMTRLGDGVSIGLKAGSHWREQLDIGTYANVRVGVYGGGEPPLLDASNVMASGSWTKTSGRTNVYEQTVPLDTVASGYLSVWVDDVRLAKVASTELADATPGTVYVSSETGTSTTIYVHPLGSTVPSTDAKVYEYSMRNFGLNAQLASGTVVEGIETRRNANPGGSLWVGRKSRLVDVRCYDGSAHCLQYKDGSYLENVTAEDVYYLLDQPTHFVAYEDTPASLGIRHISCRAVQNGALVVGYGFYGHMTTSGDFGTVTYDDCESENIDRGWGGSGANYVLNDAVYSGTDGYLVLLTNESNFTVNRGLIDGVISLIRFASGDNHVVVLNDVTAASTATTISGAGGVDNVDLTITNCHLTELGTADGSTGVVVITGATPTITSNGNTFVAPGNHFPYYFDGVPTLDSDGNTFTIGNRFRSNATNYADLAAWQAATSQDATSTAV